MGTDRGRPASDTEVINYARMGHDPDSLASAVVEVCLSNYRFVEGLGQQWGFDCAFFWQPTVWTGDKELTSNELVLAAGGGGVDFAVGSDPEWKPLLESCYERYHIEADSIPAVYTLENAFDGLAGQVYTDLTGVHLTADGDSILAARIMALLSSDK